MQKQRLAQQKQQILGQIGTGNLDYEKAGRSLIALGDTQAGATLLGLGQKQQERDLEKTWMGGGVANPTAATPMALGSPNEVESRFLGGVQKAGLTNPNGLAAVAAYGKSESGYSPGNVNKTWSDPSESGAAGTSGGIMSWRAERLQNLQNFARQRGEQGNGSPETQAAFLAQEDPTLVPRLNAAKTPQEANQIMADAWRFAGYNRPGQGEFARREGLTGAYAQRYAGQPAAQPQQPVQVAETEADVQRLEQEQARAPDAPAPGAANAQGFAIPGGENEYQQRSILSDKNVQHWQNRLN
ncbi:MAG TPA: phage tail tip lysozyme, partial [Burkholderiaceae bacterium]